MNQKSMTALVSAFSRAYHSEHNEVKIFDDSVAKQLISDEEYAQISAYMAQGIAFFDPSFKGSDDEALRFVVDSRLSPSPLGRAAFAEKSLMTAVKIGALQYLILGAGYDTFAYRQPEWAKKLKIFELDRPATAKDKTERLKQAGIEIPENVHFVSTDFTCEKPLASLISCADFDSGKISFCSILGVSYYLSETDFRNLIHCISSVLSDGSSIVFDYPDEDNYTEKAGARAKKQAMLAEGANEKMLAKYSYEDIEKLLSDAGLLVYEHLTPEQITEQFFRPYNEANPSHRMTAFDNVNYCLAVKKGFSTLRI